MINLFCGNAFDILFSEELVERFRNFTTGNKHIITDPDYDWYGSIEKEKQLSDLCCNLANHGNVVLFSRLTDQVRLLDADPSDVSLWIKHFRTMYFTQRCGASSFVEKISIFRFCNTFNVLNWQQMTGVYHDLQEEKTLYHPYQKPYSLIRRLVLLYTNPGDLVIDPFFGSGMVAKVCKDLGRNFVGTEINKEYYDHAVSWVG